MELRGRDRQQVGAPDDELDSLIGVVDDDGEVVGRNVIVSTQHDVVDRPLLRAEQLVVEGDLVDLATEPDGERTPRRHALTDRRRVEVATGTWVTSFRTVRSERPAVSRAGCTSSGRCIRTVRGR